MALVTITYVVCDVCGAPGSEPVEGAISTTHYAEANGFKHSTPSNEYAQGRPRRRRDLCPAHAVPGSSEREPGVSE